MGLSNSSDPRTMPGNDPVTGERMTPEQYAEFMKGTPERFEEPDTGSSDPFHPDNAHVVSLIMQMRIYDVLMALLTDTDPDAAKMLLELHADGTIFGPTPALNGRFITDEIRAEQEEV